MNNSKKLMYAKNSFRNIPKKEIEAFETEVYADEKVVCVDAIYLCQNTNCDKQIKESQKKFTWYIPTDRTIEIETGDILFVKQTEGDGLAFVRAVSAPYTKTREQHENEIHPYKKVISNLGKD